MSQTPDTRSDRPHIKADLSYPIGPDNKGYAMRHYKGRTYYFGAHNTRDSFVLFGEWRRRLLETGTPQDTKSLKAELRESGDIGDESHIPLTPGVPSAAPLRALVAVAFVFLASNTITWYVTASSIENASTPKVLFVDEEFGVITADDREVLRGHRRHIERHEKLSALHNVGREDRIAARRAALLEGANDGKEATEEEGS